MEQHVGLFYFTVILEPTHTQSTHPIPISVHFSLCSQNPCKHYPYPSLLVSGVAPSASPMVCQPQAHTLHFPSLSIPLSLLTPHPPNLHLHPYPRPPEIPMSQPPWPLLRAPHPLNAPSSMLTGQAQVLARPIRYSCQSVQPSLFTPPTKNSGLRLAPNDGPWTGPRSPTPLPLYLPSPGDKNKSTETNPMIQVIN